MHITTAPIPVAALNLFMQKDIAIIISKHNNATTTLQPQQQHHPKQQHGTTKQMAIEEMEITEKEAISNLTYALRTAALSKIPFVPFIDCRQALTDDDMFECLTFVITMCMLFPSKFC